MKILLDTHVPRDPFDRVLVAQSLQFEMTLASMDETVRAYGVSLLSSI